MWSGGAYQSTHRMQQYIDWNPISLDGNDLFRRVDDLTDLVYERLLTRPNIQLQSRGRIHTIPDDCSLNIPPPQLDPIREGQILQPIGDLIEPPISSGRGAVESTGIEDRNHDTLASEINEYLLSMNLEELSEHEREYMSRINSGSRHFLIDQPMEETAESHRQGHDGTSGQPQPSNAQGSSQQNAHFSSSKRSSWSFGTDPLDALSLAASIIQFVDFAAKISFKLTSAYRHTSDSPRELQDLSKRLMQYSGLLRTAAEVVRTSMPTGELQEIGWKILEDSRQTMKGVESLLDKYRIRPGQRLVSAFRALQWQSAKKNVGAIMEEVESLKSTLSVMLQLHQITMTENQIQMAEERSFEITKLY